MSLAAALKAGLKKGADAGDDGAWDPYPESDAPAPQRPAAQPKAKSGDARGERSARQEATPVDQSMPRAKQTAKAPPPAANNAGSKAAQQAQTKAQTVPQKAVTRPRGPRLSDLGPAPEPVNRNARPAGVAAPRPAARAAKPSAQPAHRPDTSWLDEPEAPRVNPKQYIRELEHYASEQNRKSVRATVMDVSSKEIEGVARTAAKIRGRYLARLLDAGTPPDGMLKHSSVEELTRYRQAYEELQRGLDTLKQAIAEGDVNVRGMIPRG